MKFQMLFEQNIASNVTRNQESKHTSNSIILTKSHRTMQNHTKPLETMQNHVEPQETKLTMKNHMGTHGNIWNYAEPREITQNNYWEHIETF